MSTLFEVCCGSAEDAVGAAKGGAYCAELCSDLFHGGLTPSVGSLLEVKEKAPGIKVMCMVRPREGGFCYTDTEFSVMLRDAKAFCDAGADGIVFGFLHDDGTIDMDRCRAMMEVIGEKESVFHRAIDVVPDIFNAMEQLIALGVTRILTSGGCATVPEGAEVIRKMIQQAAGRIQIQPGGGIRPYNAKECLERTGAAMLHASCHRVCYDRSALGNDAIHFGGAVEGVYPPEDRYKVVFPEDVAAFLENLK